MIFNDLFPSYQVFRTALNVLIDIYKDENEKIKAEWLDEKIIFSSFKTLYFHLNNFYKNRQIRYTSEIWMGLFLNRFADSSFDLFFKQQAFYNKELQKIRDYQERDTANVTKTSGGDTTNSASSPTTLGGFNAPLTAEDQVAEKRQTKLDLNSTSTTENYNIISNLRTLLEYKYRIGIDNFIESFNDLFRQYIADKIY